MVTRRAAVTAAQEALKTEFPRLVVDGIWGPRTDSSFVRSTESTKLLVASVARDLGFTVDNLRLGYASSESWISEADARAHAVAAANLVGIAPSYLFFLLELEPQRRMTFGGREYNVGSVSPNGAYKGLFQIGSAAWEDARPVAAKAGVTLGSYEANWRDPYKNAVAAAAFAVRNTGYARSIHGYKGKVDDSLLYAMHNQGHTFISSARKGGMGWYATGQSSKARAVLSEAAQVVRA